MAQWESITGNGIKVQFAVDEVITNLINLGYLPSSDTSISATKLKQAIKKYQKWHGLTVDGIVGEMTSLQMIAPRCGRPDYEAKRESVSEWPEACQTKITCAHRISNLRGISDDDAHKAWLAALRNWSAVCGANLVYSTNYNSARIRAEVGPTDGNVLAYSYLPNQNCSERLQQRYGTKWQWTYVKLLEVMTHEIGHAIGLSHGPANSIMNATALGKFTKPQRWDIDQVVSRYGKATDTPTPPAPVPPGESLKIEQDIEIADGIASGTITVNGRPHIIIPIG